MNAISRTLLERQFVRVDLVQFPAEQKPCDLHKTIGPYCNLEEFTKPSMLTGCCNTRDSKDEQTDDCET